MSSAKSSQKASRPKPSRHRSTLSLQKTEIMINVYDLLPPGRLSSILWTVGASLLHSGVVINKKEYAYGGHDKRGHTGVYWTKPNINPPGGTFRCEILHGFTVSPQAEIDNIIKEASEAFQGTSYNLLTKNCNHFTAYLCEKLTGRPGPSWLNRAASIGVALPCVVPKEWIAPPDFDTADGELLDDDEHSVYSDSHEGSRMLGNMDTSHQRWSVDNGSRSFDEEWASEEERTTGKGKGKAPVRDTSGRVVPPADRAPTSSRVSFEGL
ncbi:DeSI-like protein sdu1 [Lachnellula suecica]|uniref:DeSI-like protein sdu1 n=1 Tax=Lachnellula suecica TaxID=602035 RepID=A0A8T9C6T9_9HELO|nr:DeSI-like protein sdu1 [Lachnellula suecica]